MLWLSISSSTPEPVWASVLLEPPRTALHHQYSSYAVGLCVCVWFGEGLLSALSEQQMTDQSVLLQHSDGLSMVRCRAPSHCHPTSMSQMPHRVAFRLFRHFTSPPSCSFWQAHSSAVAAAVTFALYKPSKSKMWKRRKTLQGPTVLHNLTLHLTIPWLFYVLWSLVCKVALITWS